ncbi:MAG: hypothetical protein IJ004_06220 [Clostridia bacterium]|nr:hypothetical protein [Clostridia bacterium]
MPKISHYDFGFAQVEVIRPDITDEERSKILQRALTPYYHACVDAGIDITEKGGKSRGRPKRNAI